MEYILHFFRLYPGQISWCIQAVIYVVSTFFFLKGLWLSFLAFRHLRNIKMDALNHKAREQTVQNDLLVVFTAKTLYAAHQEYRSNPYPRSFLLDATRQLVENMFETNYIQKITMLTSLLPPMGFIGTVFGMIMIFLAKTDPNSEFNTIGLGAALFTTLAALSAFVILEAFKIRLNNLSQLRIQSGLSISIPETVNDDITQ